MCRHRPVFVLALALLLGLVLVVPASAGGSEAGVQPRAPSNDNQQSAWPVGTLPASWTINTAGATTQSGEWLGPCEGYNFSATVWYSMTVTANSQATVDTFTSSFDTIMAVYTGPSGGPLAQVTCDDDTSPGSQSKVSFSATAGVTYWIQVGGYAGATGTLVLHASATPIAPNNDNFANAWAIGTGAGVTNHGNVGATTQPGEPLGCALVTMDHTTWYSMTVGTNSNVTVNTRGADFDTVLAIYTGSWGSLTRVTCNDDINYPTDKDSEVTFAGVPGVTYWIQVGSAGVYPPGTYPVNITRVATGGGLVNDNFAGAIALGTGAGVTGHTNVGATTQAGEPLGCSPVTMDHTTWYSMTVGANSNVTVNTRGADFDTVLAIYTGSWGSLTRVTCNDDINGTADRDSEVVFAGTPGVTYYIQVGGVGLADTGHYPVNITRVATGGGVTCRGLPATIVGTAGDDAPLNGTAGADVIAGLGGNDEIYGLGGNDVICAGTGADEVWGGLGDDVIVGQPGNDSMWGQGGNDQLFGNGGRDYLHGGLGFDTLQGGIGVDTCVAGEAGTC